jgi:restriction endonuclease S subunit
LTIADLNDGSVSESKEHVTDDAVVKARMRPVSEGTVLLSYKLSLGKLGIAARSLYTNEAIAALPPRPGIDLFPEYLFYALSTVDYVALCHGAVKGKCLNRASLGRIPVPYPPPSEQRRIVEILDQADALRKKRAEADAKAARILPALFYRMFGDPVSNPKGWPVSRLGDLCRIIRGASPRPKGDPRYFGGPIPWIMISDVTRQPGKYLTTTRETLTEEGKKRSVFLDSGTLILTNSATIGIPKVISFDGCIHDGFLAFLDLDDRLEQDYLFFYFSVCRESLVALAPSGTQRNLNTGIAKSLRLPLPPRSLQDRFSGLAARLLSCSESQARSYQTLNELFRTVLHLAFSGNLTARWREAHMKELLEEMEQQAKALGSPDL